MADSSIQRRRGVKRARDYFVRACHEVFVMSVGMLEEHANVCVGCDGMDGRL